MPTTIPPKKSECLVIPLDLQLKPYKTFLSRTDKTHNSLIFNLKSLKAKQAEFRNNPLLDWQTILIGHVKTAVKLTVKDMKEFGEGAFTLSKVLQREYVIYPGQLVNSALTVDLPLQERIYYLRVPYTELCFDPKYTECVAKYFQHLPRADPDVLAEFHGEMHAEENFASDIAYVEINFESESYVIPVRVLGAREDVEAGCMVGFDYGNKYWKLLNKNFTYFTKAGVPIKSYCFTVNEFKYVVSQTTFTGLLNDGFFINEKRFLFLPSETRQAIKNLLTQANNAAVQTFNVQAVGEFNLQYCVVIYNGTGDDREPASVLVKIPQQVTKIHTRPIFTKFADNSSYPVPAPVQAISIKLLLTAKLKELIVLHEELSQINHYWLALKVGMTLPQPVKDDKSAESQRNLIVSLFDQGLFRQQRAEQGGNVKSALPEIRSSI
jgi:hypothetical protein